MALWWLSFANPKLPEGERFLGVALVEASGADQSSAVANAIKRAWATKCNPGGEIEAYELDLDGLTNAKRVILAKAPKHVLMSREDLEHHNLL